MIAARILIVEDDRIVARDIQHQLSRMGHVVVGMSASGEDAVRLACSQQPDLVLMDIRLEGEMDGIEAARRIRDAQRIPIVFLTAYANDEVVQRASLTEPFGYLLKPFEEPQMRTVIQMALYKHASDTRLRLSERRYAATLASIRDGVILCNRDGRVDFMNRAAETMTGWTAAEAAGQPLSAVFVAVDEETQEPLEDFSAVVLRSGEFAPPERQSRLLPRGGEEPAGIVVEERCSAIIDDRGDLVGSILVFRDLTQRRRIAEALRTAQADLAHIGRLTMMGELAAAVAHEVNQPLMAIVTNAGTCLQHLSQPQPDLDRTRVVVERIVRDAQRAGDVVRSIRALARRTPVDPGWVDISALIADTLELVRAELRRARVTVETDLRAEPPWVHGDRVQLQQLVLNLVMNAIEAMSADDLPERRLRIVTGSDAGLIRVRVEDSGPGIADADVDDIFRALYTTKPDGLGMGLSISRSIVELHGGRLTATPGAAGGSVFEVVLPVSPGGK
ncbi:PAS domain S-box-containing protein [Azospirillum lipoferum]|uniref:histidine kinase n=1 Tax=Azospirillum lipoferum TaxID=193 RepID=A0A5A9GPC5_AZOLI|nr:MULTISPECIES: response regulator [Azospirillum]KAA0596203.1 response regulator [Azospirillum lipoferum]MCP1611166.1 PAS domain S-box-containing protein [Azospirillum lipoferum]MDW5533709.1 response regulator [Azospirillum sp. NL1]